MNINVGNTDRGLRVVAGLVLIGLTLADIIGPWGWLGILPIATGLLRVCPAYSLLGMNTCGIKKP
jgi:hypothetical protein